MSKPPPGAERGLTAGFLRNYDLVSLRLLLSAIDEGNLAKVAARDDISLSAVSRRIARERSMLAAAAGKFLEYLLRTR